MDRLKGKVILISGGARGQGAAEGCAQARSRMPVAAAAKRARSVLDGAEQSAILFRQGRRHLLQRGNRRSQRCSIIGGAPPRSAFGVTLASG